MKYPILLLILLFSFTKSQSQDSSKILITSDIDHFWTAYDAINSNSDSAIQADLLHKIFLEPGSQGLKAIMEVREYTAQSYMDAIHSSPKFWASIRGNTLKAKGFADEIGKGIEKFRLIYPSLRPAKIYFTIGAFRTPGTTLGDKVLIGSELALTDSSTVETDLPKEYQRLKSFFNSNPIHDVVLLNVHEYVHTQQKEMVHNLLSLSLYEGIAEFVSVKAMGVPSIAPAIEYGKKNETKVKAKFEYDMYRGGKRKDWLWNNTENEFATRDLGYYIGYAISERYYNQATDKLAAIKAMIELDYTNEAAVERFIDTTHYFSATIGELYSRFEAIRPTVIGLVPFQNGSKQVPSGLHQITIQFSAPMNKSTRGFDFGPLGESNALMVKKVIGFSEDGKSISIEVDLKPNQRYQVVLSPNFRTLDGLPIKPYLIDIETKE
jgi:hypothetical protein